MSQTSDPATLYAACAAAAGALVAIMGGFLISRVVGLLAQKEGLQLRRRELVRRTDLADQSLDALHRSRLSVTTSWFDRDHLKEIIECRGEVDIGALVNESKYVGTTQEEMHCLVRQRAVQVRAAFANLEAAVPSGPISEDLSGPGIEVPPGEQDIWSAVADEITRLREPRRSASYWDLAVTAIRVPTVDIVYQRQDQLIRDERAAAAQVAALTAEAELVDDELRRLGSGVPRLLMSIGILAYFALGSVALPLALLARSRVTDGPMARWGVWGLFASGLVLLVVFLITSSWPLRHRAETRSRT